MPWSIWNVPSDRDYYEQCGDQDESKEQDICFCCNARWYVGEACEVSCVYNKPVDPTEEEYDDAKTGAAA